MRNIVHPAVEAARVAVGPYGSTYLDGNNGMFRFQREGETIRVLASDSLITGWEHVSVSVEGAERCPTWEEMCFVKDLFWDDEEAVIQFHPPKSQYVNFHKYCLHLWRLPQFSYPLPPTALVGPSEVTS